MPMRDWVFVILRPHPCSGGWCLIIRGTRAWAWGPFDSEQLAKEEEMRIFQRWNRAARQRGGWAWKTTPRKWVITAPPEVEVQGEPLVHGACTRHMSSG
jgi:hypothetical protein